MDVRILLKWNPDNKEYNQLLDSLPLDVRINYLKQLNKRVEKQYYSNSNPETWWERERKASWREMVELYCEVKGINLNNVKLLYG